MCMLTKTPHPLAVSCLMACMSAGQSHAAHSALAGGGCTVVQTDEETGATDERCPGQEGFDVIVSYDDQRQSVSVVDGAGNVYPLDVWSVITEGFASLGPSAEWHWAAGSKVPSALIVEVRESAGPVHIAVAKLAPPNVCFVGNFTGASAKERAVRVAAGALSLPCLPPLRNDAARPEESP